jgi:hypothetical protein
VMAFTATNRRPSVATSARHSETHSRGRTDFAIVKDDSARTGRRGEETDEDLLVGSRARGIVLRSARPGGGFTGRVSLRSPPATAGTRRRPV